MPQTFKTAVVAVCLAACTIFAAPQLPADQEPADQQPAALDYAGIYPIRSADPELTGIGITIASVCRSATYIDLEPQDDYKPNLNHNCFANSTAFLVARHNTQTGLSDHSTAVSAILVGSDPNGWLPELGQFRYEGSCPQARLDIYEFWRFVSSYIFGARQLQADLLTMSMGSIYQDWWTRGVERLADKNALTIIAGIGNGTSVFDPPLYPAAGANVIGVGVINSIEDTSLSRALSDFTLPTPKHSSAGPTADKRCKPDIVAPGNCIVPLTQGKTDYAITGDWSSYATPVVAGTAALLIQKAKQQPQLQAAIANPGGNCVIKAILLNSATKLPFWHKGLATKNDDHIASLDYIQGAGAVNTIRAYFQLISGQAKPGPVDPAGWDNGTIQTVKSEARVYKLNTDQTQNQYLTATLTWNKHFSDQYPFKPQGLSDLRLEVWAVNPNNLADSYLLDYSDSPRDNVEHIYCPLDPNYPAYSIIVSCSGSTGNAPQNESYGLAWSISSADSQDNIWWYDLNADGRIDNIDHIIFSALENLPDARPFLIEAFQLDAERITLIEENYRQWQNFFKLWLN